LLFQIEIPGFGWCLNHSRGGDEGRKTINTHPGVIAMIILTPGAKELVGKNDVAVIKTKFLLRN